MIGWIPAGGAAYYLSGQAGRDRKARWADRDAASAARRRARKAQQGRYVAQQNAECRRLAASRQADIASRRQTTYRERLEAWAAAGDLESARLLAGCP